MDSKMSGKLVGLLGSGGITAMQSNCCLVTSVIPQEVILGLVLFSVLLITWVMGFSASSRVLSNVGK